MIGEKRQAIKYSHLISNGEKLQSGPDDTDLLFNNTGDKELGFRRKKEESLLQPSTSLGAWNSDHTEKEVVDLSGVGKWRRYCLKQ